MSEPLHLWHRCSGCGMRPIVGLRYHCETCPAGPDTELCESCHRRLLAGDLRHPAAGLQPLAGSEHRFIPVSGQQDREVERWLEITAASADPPQVADGFVLRPEFRAGLDSSFGAYAFAVAGASAGLSGDLLLTALHIMDELMKRQGIDGKTEPGAGLRELAQVVTRVQLYDVFAPNWMLAELGQAGPMWVLPGARLGDEEPLSDGDIAVFDLPASELHRPAPLAPGPPAVGDPIYLAVRHDDDPGRRTLAAVVVESSARSMIFRFDDPQHEARHTSGAPLLDRDGRVVGINVGAGLFAGQLFGHGNHVGNIRRHLESGHAPSSA